MVAENKEDARTSRGDGVRKRGRPPGRTAAGEATRRRLYETAIARIGERGYEAVTLREIATRAGVTHAVLYRYFPSKRAIVLALYDDLSGRFAADAATLPAGPWRVRYQHALERSLAVLGPHRVTLRALVPVLVGDAEDGVFAERTAFSRARVQGVFAAAVAGASDAPAPALAAALGRVLYLAHLGVILWWLLDRSPRQRATARLIALLGRMLPSMAFGLRLGPMRGFVRSADELVIEALLGPPSVGAAL